MVMPSFAHFNGVPKGKQKLCLLAYLQIRQVCEVGQNSPCQIVEKVTSKIPAGKRVYVTKDHYCFLNPAQGE